MRRLGLELRWFQPGKAVPVVRVHRPDMDMGSEHYGCTALSILWLVDSYYYVRFKEPERTRLVLSIVWFAAWNSCLLLYSTGIEQAQSLNLNNNFSLKCSSGCIRPISKYITTAITESKSLTLCPCLKTKSSFKMDKLFTWDPLDLSHWGKRGCKDLIELR